MIQLKTKDIKPLKEKWHNDQGCICPILKKVVPLDEVVIDHMHTKSDEEPDAISGKGLCRGAIQFQANALEGKFTNAFKRLGLSKHIDMIDFLRNLADYLEYNRQHTEDELYIHPTEAPKKPKLLKSSYNKLVKTVDGKQKVPQYNDKNGNYTKVLQKLFEKYDVEPKFKKV